MFFHQLNIFSPCQLVFYLWRWSLQDSLHLSSHVAAACQHKETTRKKREVRELHLQSLILVKLENICSTLPAQQRTQQTTLFSGHLINSIQISTKGWKSNTPVLWRSWVTEFFLGFLCNCLSCFTAAKITFTCVCNTVVPAVHSPSLQPASILMATL